MVVVLGIMLGAAFTPDALERAYLWLGSITALLAYVAVVAVSIALTLHRTFGFERTTAYFSASPGGFSAMVLLGGAMGGDERTIALMHSVRLLLTVLIIPFWFRLFQGYEPAPMSALGLDAGITVSDTIILIILALAGLYGGRALRLPAAYLVGPLLLSAGAHLSGLTETTPPGVLVATAQVVIGTAIGCRFTGVPVRRVLKILLLGAASTLFMLATAAVLAAILAEVTGLPFEALILALSPGGVAEMSLISLSMGIDTAFVTTHHVIRIMFLVVLAPVAYRFMSGMGKDPPE
jgi:membrane AbrB-like protein